MAVQAKQQNDPAVAVAAFDLMTKHGERLPDDLFSLILAVLVEKPEEHYDDAMRIYREATSPTSRTSALPAVEAIFSNTLRIACKHGKLSEASRILAEMESAGHKPRHRALSPLLECALKLKEFDDAIAIYERLLKNVDEPSEEDFAVIIKETSPVSGSAAADAMFGRCVSDLLKFAWNPPSQPLLDALISSPRFTTQNAHIVESADGGGGQQQQQHTCSACGERVVGVKLPPDTIKTLVEQTEKLAPDQKSEKVNEWTNFKAWVEKIDNRKYDVIIDGANVAYYRMSNSHSTQSQVAPDYNQIDAVFTYVRDTLKKKPIVFLHRRHFNRHRGGGVPHSLENKWKAADALFVVPHGHNDDVYWLYFGFSLDCWIVTNDQMRDHRFEMLQSIKAFGKWKQRHQVHFDVMWLEKEKRHDAQLFPPTPYSIHAQQQRSSASSSSTPIHIPKEAPRSESEAAEAAEMERLEMLPAHDLKALWGAKKITSEQYRAARRRELGCLPNDNVFKRYEWLCVREKGSSSSSSSASSSSS